MNAAAMINDYERLRAAALTQRSASGSRRRLKQLVGEGLHAWLMARSDAQAPRRTPTSSGVSPERNVQLTQQRHDMVQLLASMTLQSLTEDTHVYLQ